VYYLFAFLLLVTVFYYLSDFSSYFNFLFYFSDNHHLTFYRTSLSLSPPLRFYHWYIVHIVQLPSQDGVTPLTAYYPITGWQTLLTAYYSITGWRDHTDASSRRRQARGAFSIRRSVCHVCCYVFVPNLVANTKLTRQLLSSPRFASIFLKTARMSTRVARSFKCE
jgi:hypothetical protein